MKSLYFFTRLEELLEQSWRVAEWERQWQNEVMLQEIESQASNTTERDIEESREEKTNELNRAKTIKDRAGDQNLMVPSMPIRNGLTRDVSVNRWLA